MGVSDEVLRNGVEIGLRFLVSSLRLLYRYRYVWPVDF